MNHQPATGRGDGRACAEERVTARDTAREALARTLRQIENDAAGIVVSGPFEALSDMARGMWLDQADRLLASPALDAVLAERVAALAEDEALLEIVAVLRALAAARDRAPCPTCGGDRLRGDFTAPGSGRCHVGGTTADCRAAASTGENDRG